MLNSYSILADEVVVKPSELTTTTDVVIQKNDVGNQKSDIVVILDKDVDVPVDENGSQSIQVSVTLEQTESSKSLTTTIISDNSSTTAKSTENIVENMKDDSKLTTIVDNDGYVDRYDYNYVSSIFYENNDQNNQSSESEPTTGQMISTSITDVSKKDDVSLETSREPIVGTLTPLGVTDETKPVGLLEYLHRLPNTSSGAMKLSVLLGTFVISGLIIGLLYKFSRKIFK
jgi:hypothetical protein